MTKQTQASEIDGEEVRHFVQTAERFCTAIEQHSELSKIEFFELMDGLLPQLYSGARSLPELELEDDEEPWNWRTDEAGRVWSTIQEQLETMLGDHDVFQDIYDPVSPGDDEPLSSRISYHLADVFTDLKDYVDLYRRGTSGAIRQAVWQWRFSFTSHWGLHALAALRVVHSLLYAHLDED